MSYEPWLNYLKSAEKVSVLGDAHRKVHYKFPDGKQMVEEFNLETGVVQRRAWRKCKQLMGEPEWEMEIGEMPRQLGQIGQVQPTDTDFVCKESTAAPSLSKRITKKNIEWRISNLPYLINVFDITADKEKRAIVVRTKNKKYYKVIPVPELDRCGLLPEQANISKHHQYNTLIITYKKPDLLCEMEAQVLLLLKEVPTETDMNELMKGLMETLK